MNQAILQTGQHQSSTIAVPNLPRFQRVKVNLLGRFMLSNYEEHPCQIIEMSPGNAKVISPVSGKKHERVVVYIDHIGRIEGEIEQEIEGGFAIIINASSRKREKLANQLTWLANRDELNLPEDRRHQRVEPENPYSHITMPDGRDYRCKVIDMSLSGAAILIDIRPAIGSPLTLGKMRARVIRHFEDGVALEFSALQNAENLIDHLNIK